MAIASPQVSKNGISFSSLVLMATYTFYVTFFLPWKFVSSKSLNDSSFHFLIE